jgi:hypothetical protein
MIKPFTMAKKLYLQTSLLLLAFVLFGCNKNHPPVEVGRLQFVQSTPDEILDKIQPGEETFIFITTSWCQAGARTFNNIILRDLNILKEKGTPYFLIYYGDEPRTDFTSDSLKTLETETVYHVSNSLMNNPLVHKIRIVSFLTELDDNYHYKNSTPVMVCYRDGKLSDCSIYNGDLVDHSELKLFRKEELPQ